jgi:hypothetical protein
MKKVIGLVVVMVMVSFGLAFAGQFNFGVGTYEQYDDILVVNSLGDKPSISTFGNLGANDFIPENSFKNVLGYEGYSIAYDYNPTYTGLYSGIYEQVLPTGVDLTKIQIGGLAGNPRAIQDVYVLTSEYNRLSAQGQANSIDVLNNGLSSEINDRISEDKLLQKNINKVENQSINRDNQLGNRITKETSQRKTADKKLDNKINTETTNRKQADKVLQGNINTEAKQRKLADKQLQNNINTETQDRKTADKVEKKARILGDKKLQNNINVVDTNSKSRDNILQENINTETIGRINGDNFLNSRINDTNMVVDSHSKTLQNHENRINTLEETQYNIEGVLRILDTKKTTIEIYNTYDTGHSRNVAVGVRVTYKLGKSYQDKVNEKTEVRLTNLEKSIGNSPIITKVVDTKGNTKSISISANGLSINGDF